MYQTKYRQEELLKIVNGDLRDITNIQARMEKQAEAFGVNSTDYINYCVAKGKINFVIRYLRGIKTGIEIKRGKRL